MSGEREKLDLILNKFTEAIEPVVKEALASNVGKKFRPVIEYQVSTGGKGLRPTLAAISCLMLGGRLKDVLHPAAGLEILHNYTLIIDDIIDHSRIRRGKLTTWSKYGKSIAQCIGIDYGATIFQTTNKTNKRSLLSDVFIPTIKSIVEGEILDILFERFGRENEPYVVKNRYKKINEKDYFEMISKKTASLFKTSCQTGAICAGAKKKETEAIGRYGFNLGMVFQITDDILDIFGKEKEFKKKIGKDIEERKEGNIVILLALKEMKPAARNKFLGIMRKDKIIKRDIKLAVGLIETTSSREKAYRIGKRFTEAAKKALKDLPHNRWNVFLDQLADYTLSRKT